MKVKHLLFFDYFPGSAHQAEQPDLLHQERSRWP